MKILFFRTSLVLFLLNLAFPLEARVRVTAVRKAPSATRRSVTNMTNRSTVWKRAAAQRTSATIAQEAPDTPFVPVVETPVEITVSPETVTQIVTQAPTEHVAPHVPVRIMPKRNNEEEKQKLAVVAATPKFRSLKDVVTEAVTEGPKFGLSRLIHIMNEEAGNHHNPERPLFAKDHLVAQELKQCEGSLLQIPKLAKKLSPISYNVLDQALAGKGFRDKVKLLQNFVAA